VVVVVVVAGSWVNGRVGQGRRYYHATQTQFFGVYGGLAAGQTMPSAATLNVVAAFVVVAESLLGDTVGTPGTSPCHHQAYATISASGLELTLLPRSRTSVFEKQGAMAVS
jgi:hypothetical protein